LPFQLQIKPAGNGFLKLGEFNEHSEAHEAMLTHFKELELSIPKIKPGCTVSLQMVHSDVFQVSLTNNLRRFNNTGLHSIYRIIEHPDEKMPAEELQRLGINEEAKRYKLGPRAYKKEPTLPVGNSDDIDWSEL
jgi:hypothetical protein